MYVCSFFYLKSFITIAHLDYYSKMLPYSGRISLFKWFENHLLKKEANLEHLGRKGNTKNQICKEEQGSTRLQRAAGLRTDKLRHTRSKKWLE